MACPNICIQVKKRRTTGATHRLTKKKIKNTINKSLFNSSISLFNTRTSPLFFSNLIVLKGNQ